MFYISICFNCYVIAQHLPRSYLCHNNEPLPNYNIGDEVSWANANSSLWSLQWLPMGNVQFAPVVVKLQSMQCETLSDLYLWLILFRKFADHPARRLQIWWTWLWSAMCLNAVQYWTDWSSVNRVLAASFVLCVWRVCVCWHTVGLFVSCPICTSYRAMKYMRL